MLTDHERAFLNQLAKMTVEVLRAAVVRDGELRHQLDELHNAMSHGGAEYRHLTALMDRVTYTAEKLTIFNERQAMSLMDYKCLHGVHLFGDIKCADCEIARATPNMLKASE